MEILSPVLNGPVVTVGNHMLETGKSVVISELSRLQMAESIAAAREAEARQQAEQPPQAGQPQTDQKPQAVPADAQPEAAGEKAP